MLWALEDQILRSLFSTIAMGTGGRVPCPVTLPVLMNVLTVNEDPVNSRVRVAVVPAQRRCSDAI